MAEQGLIIGTPEQVEAYKRRLAVTALGTLRLVCLSGAAPIENVAHALGAVHLASALVEERPGNAAAGIAAAHSLALAYRQVSEMEATTAEAFTTAMRWLRPRAGLLQGGPARAWEKHMFAMAAALGRARLALQEASLLCNAASAGLAVAANTWYGGGSTKRREWSTATKRYLADAHGHLVRAQVDLAEARAAALPAIDATKLLLQLL